MSLRAQRGSLRLDSDVRIAEDFAKGRLSLKASKNGSLRPLEGELDLAIADIGKYLSRSAEARGEVRARGKYSRREKVGVLAGEAMMQNFRWGELRIPRATLSVKDAGQEQTSFALRVSHLRGIRGLELDGYSRESADGALTLNLRRVEFGTRGVRWKKRGGDVRFEFPARLSFEETLLSSKVGRLKIEGAFSDIRHPQAPFSLHLRTEGLRLDHLAHAISPTWDKISGTTDLSVLLGMESGVLKLEVDGEADAFSLNRSAPFALELRGSIGPGLLSLDFRGQGASLGDLSARTVVRLPSGDPFARSVWKTLPVRNVMGTEIEGKEVSLSELALLFGADSKTSGTVSLSGKGTARDFTLTASIADFLPPVVRKALSLKVDAKAEGRTLHLRSEAKTSERALASIEGETLIPRLFSGFSRSEKRLAFLVDQADLALLDLDSSMTGTVSFAGQVTLGDSHLRGAIEGDGQFDNLPVRSVSFKTVLNDGELKILTHARAGKYGRLYGALHGKILGSPVRVQSWRGLGLQNLTSARFSARSVPLRALEPWTSPALTLSGTVDAAAEMGARGRSLSTQFQAKGVKLGAGLRELEVRGSGSSTPRGTEFSVDIEDVGQATFRLAAGGAPLFRRQEEVRRAPVRGRLSLQVDEIAEVIESPLFRQSLHGKFLTEVEMTGSLASPEIRGRVNANGLKIGEHRLTEVQAQFAMEHDRWTSSGRLQQDENRGLSFSASKKERLAVEFRANQFQLGFVSPIVRSLSPAIGGLAAVVDGHLRVEDQAKEPTVSGAMTLKEGELQLAPPFSSLFEVAASLQVRDKKAALSAQARSGKNGTLFVEAEAQVSNLRPRNVLLKTYFESGPVFGQLNLRARRSWYRRPRGDDARGGVAPN